jgi:NADH-quinone oxidoreductase subunit N
MRTTVLLPELLVAATALALVALTRLRFLPPRWLAAGALLVTLVALGLELWLGAQVGTLFGGGWQQDRFSLFAKAALLVVIVGFMASSDWDAETTLEVLPLAFLAVFGGMVVASATSLPGVWAGLELAALSGVAAGGVAARETGLRLLTVSALAGGLVTVGFAFLYAVTGAATLSGLRQTLINEPVTLPLALIALLTLTGVAIRVGLAPFQPAAAGGVVLSALGAAVLTGLTAGVATLTLAKLVGAMYGANPAWGPWLAVLASFAMLLGGLRAVTVASPRVLAAWLVVQQVGWVAAGLATHDERGIAAALFLLVPVLLGATAAPLLTGPSEGNPSRFAGMARREPARALGLALVLLSLAGVPPLAGFFGEFTVAIELVRSGLAWVLACGLLGALLCTAGVVRALRLVYLEQSPEEGRGPGSRRSVTWTVGPFVPAALVAVYGFLANPIHNLAIQGAAALGLH